MQVQLMFGPVAAVAGAATVMAWRVRETTRPVSLRSIMIPPLAMSTGFMMFVAPEMRIPLSWAVGAFLAGALLFSWPLASTSRLERTGDAIVMRRSPAFLLILLALFVVRFVLREYIDRVISPLQTGALFFVLAFGMILVWRLRMLREYRGLAGD